MAKIYMINVNEFGEWNKYEYLKQFVSKECRKRADKFYFVEDAKRTVGAELLVRYYLRLNYNTSNRKIEMEYNQYGKLYIKIAMTCILIFLIHVTGLYVRGAITRLE